jgi:hypothetical protein
MGVRHIDGASAKLYLLGGGRDPRDERDARGDVLSLVGDVLANIGFGESQLVSQQESFAVFPKG